MAEKVIVRETQNKVIVSTPGLQGPRGRTILNGNGAPANNLGLEGDYYYNVPESDFYGPKLSDSTWANATIIKLAASPESFAKTFSWELAQVQGPTAGLYSIAINHNLGFHPNVTIKDSAGDIWETGIDYNSLNTITLTMAQPFSGTAYLS